MIAAARAFVAVLLLSSGAFAAAEPTVTLDPRLETLGIVSMLAGTAPEGFVSPDIEYARRARKAFSKFKDHPAVRLTAALPLKFDYRHRSDSVLRRGPMPGLSPLLFTPDYLIGLAGGRERFEEWLQALAAFGREADVPAFVLANAEALEPGFSEFRKDVARRGYMAKLERSAGVAYEGEYKVYLSVFHLRGSQVNTVLRLDDGGELVQSIVGAEVLPGGRVDFRPDDFVSTAGHEISHGLLDVASALSRDRIERSRSAFGRLPWNCYGDWLQCVTETVMRAHMLRLVENELGADAYHRHLEQEGRAKWPYLEPMVEKLKLYEKDRARWPDLYAYFPELLSVLPESAPAASTAPAPGSGPGPEWAFEETSPFSTAGQRAFALRGLDRLLKAAPGDAALLRKRAAFRLLASDAAGAEKDAEASIAADPKDPAAPLARGLARRALGRGEAAAADFASAARLCRSAPALNDGARVACGAANRALNGGALTGGAGADPSVGPGVVASSPGSLPERPLSASGDEGFEFVVDPRAELLAEVLASTPTAALPAATMLSSALKAGLNPVGPAQLLFSFGDPPELAPLRAPPYGLASAFGGEAGMSAFVSAVREQARTTGFAARWAAGKAKREDMISRAQAESRRTLSPRSVSQWLGQGFPARGRFVISETLPSPFSANMLIEEGDKRFEVRMRSVLGEHEKKIYFSFDDFGGCPAHELTHTITDPLILDRSRELAAYGSLMIKGCTDNWTGCVLEHTVLAVTLRALRAERGDAVYKAMLKDYSGRGFPYLRALTERLAEYETPAARAAGFAAFMPRALDVFRDELKSRAHARAAASADAAPAAADAPVFSEEFRVDPRLELVVLLRRLGRSASERAGEAAAAPGEAESWDAAFLRFSTHPAVALTARLDALSPGLPPLLALHLSGAPDLALVVPVPAGYRAAAGGDAVDDWLEAVRKFALETRFFDYFGSRSAARAKRLEEARAEAALSVKPQAAAEYLGRALSGRHAYALSPLYPPSWPGRLSVYGAGGVDVTRVRPARPGRDGAEAYGLDEAEGSTAREILYEEAERLAPSGSGAAGSIAAACSDRGAPAWGVCEREHLVEAALLRLRRLAEGDAAYRRARAARDERAWPYLEPLLDKLAEYEAGRARWPALADYWPQARAAFGAEPAPRAEAPGGVSFAADPRLELASVLLRLSAAPRPEEATGTLGREADEKFAAFASHPAVARVAALARRGGARLPLRLALALGAPPELSDAAAPPAEWLAAAGGAEAWKGFAADARAFALEAHVWPFYDAARPRYAEMAARAGVEARYGSSPKEAEDYLGLPLPRRARFALAPLLASNVGLDFTERDSSGPVRVFVRPAAGESRFQFDSFGGSLVHTLTHAATDPLVPAGFTAPGAPPAGCGEAHAASSWRACAQEYLVYAVTLRLLAAEAGEPAASVQAASVAGRGFPRLPELIALLREYERGRSKRSNFAAFAPRLLAALSRAGGPDPKRVEAARKLSEDGVAAFAAGDAAKAVELLSRAESLDPEQPSASLSLGVSLEKLGRRDAALAAYGRAIKRALADPRRYWEVAAAALSSRATALEASGRGREARRDLERARELAPDDWPGRDDLDRRLRRGASPR